MSQICFIFVKRFLCVMIANFNKLWSLNMIQTTGKFTDRWYKKNRHYKWKLTSESKSYLCMLECSNTIVIFAGFKKEKKKIIFSIVSGIFRFVMELQRFLSSLKLPRNGGLPNFAIYRYRNLYRITRNKFRIWLDLREKNITLNWF